MKGPAYPAARLVANRLRKEFARRLEAARRQGRPDLAPEPDPEAIEAITDAAFWASLRREEGQSPKISLAFLPPEQAGQPLTLERPLALNPDTLTRLAPAVERPGIHLGVWRNGADLMLWGATRNLPSLCFVIEVVAPGLLVIKQRSGEGAGKFINVAVLEGDQIKLIDPNTVIFNDSPRLVREVLGLDSLDDAHAPNPLLQLAISMRAHGHGGSLLIVPAGTDAWRESIVAPIYYGIAPPFSGLARLMSEDPVERESRRWQDALRKAIDGVAGCTAVDGATILSDSYELLAFGAKIMRRDGLPLVERIMTIEPLEGASPEFIAAVELGGTRHLSAAQFAQDQRDSVALVASQDGRFTIVAWSPGEQVVHAHRVEALML
jgi:hypothetical protein